MKKLPVGISTFSKLIKNGYIYVDKTKYLYKMINYGELYFLSRPRRFGKSLIVSTLEELFKGNKDLFKGLYIYDKWNFEDTYPVIRLDFGDISHGNPQLLEESLNDFINLRARDFSIEIISKNLTTKFAELIEQIYIITGKKVVILIDEYDKAINKHFDDIELALKNRDLLQGFYQALKSNDKYLRFVFITGISKFAKTSIFSDLNQFKDITIHPEYSKICGYSDEDIKFYFRDYITKLIESYDITEDYLLDSLKKCYNGYSWDGKNFLSNPFSILNFFDTGKLANYWADSGTPKLLVDILKNTDVDLDILVTKKSEFVGSFPNCELENMDFATLLLQTGYFTIKTEESQDIKASHFTTGIPNKEVEESLFTYILDSYAQRSPEFIEYSALKINGCILTLDEKNLEENFEILLENASNILKGDIKHLIESFFKLLILSWLQFSGFDTEGEVVTYIDRFNALLRVKNFFLIIEFKFSETESYVAMLEEAENQIIENKYYKPYKDKNLICLAIAIKPIEVKCRFKSFQKVLKQSKNS